MRPNVKFPYLGIGTLHAQNHPKNRGFFLCPKKPHCDAAFFSVQFPNMGICTLTLKSHPQTPLSSPKITFNARKSLSKPVHSSKFRFEAQNSVSRLKNPFQHSKIRFTAPKSVSQPKNRFRRPKSSFTARKSVSKQKISAQHLNFHWKP